MNDDVQLPKLANGTLKLKILMQNYLLTLNVNKSQKRGMSCLNKSFGGHVDMKTNCLQIADLPIMVQSSKTFPWKT